MIISKNGCRIIIPAFFFLLILINNFTWCKKLNSEEIISSDQLIVKYISIARELKLYNDKYWHILLHYKRGLFGTRSLIDDPKYFLADDGKYNPKSELEAAITALFANDEAVDKKNKPDKCRFVARFNWLVEKLKIPEIELPDIICDSYENMMNQIKPTSVTLVFPSGYLDSPASMYGHTFLIIETEQNSKLLAHGINYMAHTRESFGPIFALRALLGSYKGYFSMMPYYQKVTEYSDLENRNIWEYKLNLNKQEIKRLMMHLFELDNIYSNYYFLDENCSYNLLFLLDVARSSLGLTSEFTTTVTPVDTLRVIRKKNLCDNPVFRPSKTSKIIYLASKLTVKEQNIAIKIAAGKDDISQVEKLNIPKEKKIILCDLICECLQYNLAINDISKIVYGKYFISTLKYRSSLGQHENILKTMKVPDYPENGHKPNRLALNTGVRNSEVFQEIEYRPTYHSLIDSDEGYNPGSEIVFGEIVARYYYEEKKIKLHKFNLIDVYSIPASNKFFFQPGWKLLTGVKQTFISEDDESLVAYLNAGGGLAYDISFLGRLYLFGDVETNGAKKLEKNYSLGAGGTFGLLSNITTFWKSHLYSRALYYGLGDKHEFVEAVAQQRFRLTTNSSIIFGYSFVNTYEKNWHEFIFKINLFF